MRYESTDWSLEVPEGWEHESGEDCTTFEHPRRVGAFQVSSYRKTEGVTADDLREFAGAIPLTAVSVGRLTGFLTRFSTDDRFWTKWWLRAGRQMIYVTYNCPLSERGREDEEVASMIDSLTPESGINTPSPPMNAANNETIVEIWPDPAAMDTGAPEPALVREGDLVWVAYLAEDPGFPGWEHPSVIEYVDARAGEPFGVIRFDGVVECTLGPPSDQRIHEHPLYGRGLRLYEFHRVRSPEHSGNRWIITFHDETLDIRANSARAFPMRFAVSRTEAIAMARVTG